MYLFEYSCLNTNVNNSNNMKRHISNCLFPSAADIPQVKYEFVTVYITTVALLAGNCETHRSRFSLFFRVQNYL